ncbi:MAG: biotin--[acetyl-CoA-carboxylase] ligase [Bacillota bacterium]|nr:biotin--[acetyl-CoA-carboxylase] ligase [Bacillota bacterium]
MPMGKEKILEILEKRKGCYVSGEEISESLGVSRSAVWKQVQALRELGYRITGSPHAGYLLEDAPDLLYPWEIQKGLPTRLFAKQVFHFRQVGSTNQVAQDLARKGYPEGTVVLAEGQTAGRGRWRRAWFSPPELGISLSLILRPPVTPLRVPQITLVAGVACARALHAETGVRPGIKWPNDLLLNGKKVCGILAEMEATAEQINYLILGIGINVNQQMEDFPSELRETAISLQMLTGQRLRRVLLVRRLLTVLEEEYEVYCRSGFAGARERWLAYQVTLGKSVRVQEGKEEFCGEAVDLGLDGSLLLRMPDGTLRRCAAGEVTLCRESEQPGGKQE